jgi:hypothetical protein
MCIRSIVRQAAAQQIITCMDLCTIGLIDLIIICFLLSPNLTHAHDKLNDELYN